MKTLKLTVLLLAIFAITSCTKDDQIDTMDPTPGQTNLSLGWFGDDNIGDVPSSINFGFGNEANLPSSYDMTDKFPPIGNQGQYGTCVSWTVGYNTKTALSGMDRGLTPSDLAQPENQFSPKDMFTALPDNQKGQNCNGTNFENALTLLQDRGVATMASVPYTNLGSCLAGQTDPAWTAEAANYKIKYWRKVEGNVQAIKSNIANNIPVILGARLADNFMSWNSDDVISSHSSFTNVGIHAYHALAIAGYDDSKGPNGAFRAINSWGETWGDRGFVWIDYNFLINEFGVNSLGENSLFIMANQDGEEVPPSDDTTPSPNANGVDLAPWIFNDYSLFDYTGEWNAREMEFNLYNIGTKAASATDDWNVYYLYFNAYDANEYGVMFYDEFNTSVEANTFACPDDNYCVINTSIPAQSDFGSQAFGMESIYRSYTVPEITGEYYLVMVADGSDVFAESDEENNFFYTSIDPIFFDSGFAFKGQYDESSFELDQSSSNRSNTPSFNRSLQPKRSSFKNAYTANEIETFLNKEYKNGGLKSKLQAYKSANPQSKTETYKTISSKK